MFAGAGVIAVTRSYEEKQVQGMMARSQQVVGKAAVGGPFTLTDQVRAARAAWGVMRLVGSHVGACAPHDRLGAAACSRSPAPQATKRPPARTLGWRGLHLGRKSHAVQMPSARDRAMFNPPPPGGRTRRMASPSATRSWRASSACCTLASPTARTSARTSWRSWRKLWTRWRRKRVGTRRAAAWHPAPPPHPGCPGPRCPSPPPPACPRLLPQQDTCLPTPCRPAPHLTATAAAAPGAGRPGDRRAASRPAGARASCRWPSASTPPRPVGARMLQVLSI
jgi:hypothetical protein